jgi:glyoxylase-like metal-dependent hydrolase (beta-lactamase superfamily II)
VTQPGWYQVTRVGGGITIIAEPLHEEGVKSYLVEGRRDVAVIDTGMGVGDFRGLVGCLSERDPLVLQTHGHWDHIGGSHAFARVLVHEREAYALRRGFPNAMYRPLFTPDRITDESLPAGFDLATAAIPPCEPSGTLRHSDTVDLGGRVLDVLHTPGHSPGGLSFLDRQSGALFAGDVVNFGEMWLFLPRSDAAAFRTTIRMLAGLSGKIASIYTAHGPVPLAPDDLRHIHEAYEEVWTGRMPDRMITRDIGFPERVPVDVHDFGAFTFLMGTGRYGDEATGNRQQATGVEVDAQRLVPGHPAGERRHRDPGVLPAG